MFLTTMICVSHSLSELCHPWSGTPFLCSKISATHLRIGPPQQKSTGALSSIESQTDIKMWYQYSSPSYGRQDHMSYTNCLWVSVVSHREYSAKKLTLIQLGPFFLPKWNFVLSDGHQYVIFWYENWSNTMTISSFHQHCGYWRPDALAWGHQ